MAATTSHDLSFKTADGEVTAHAQMLKDASPVISAMLASPMKEGQAQAIWVKDANRSGVSLFLQSLVSNLPRLLVSLTYFLLAFFVKTFLTLQLPH